VQANDLLKYISQYLLERMKDSLRILNHVPGVCISFSSSFNKNFLDSLRILIHVTVCISSRVNLANRTEALLDGVCFIFF